ncbi:Transmembrane_domain-containing protein [Hexamita inflata]|uniref:Transmembrane domain-containing protein n=1 Tax=Hexamita inflata TaxID=28002 RepID=A0AA86PPH8_9EUKA|nr:Transmembrane domain-containing protein [Hexamita inflata]
MSTEVSYKEFRKLMVTIPTKERVGMFPCLVVLIVGCLIFYLSFQQFFFDLAYSVNKDLYLETAVLDTYVLLTLPCSLLFCFVVSQVRIRLCRKSLNFWSVLHFLTFVLNFITSCLYITARPEQSFSFMSSLMNSSTLKVSSLVTFVQSFCKNGSVVWKSYNDVTFKGYKPAMWVTSYAFVFQFLTALCFTGLYCSDFGAYQTVVKIKQYEPDRFLGVSEQVSAKQLKAIEQTQAAAAAKQKKR